MLELILKCSVVGTCRGCFWGSWNIVLDILQLTIFKGSARPNSGVWVAGFRVVGWWSLFLLGVGVASRGGWVVISVSIVQVRVVGWLLFFLSGGRGGLSGGWAVALCLCR